MPTQNIKKQKQVIKSLKRNNIHNSFTMSNGAVN